MTGAATKAELRAAVMARRDGLSAEARAAGSAAIAGKAIALAAAVAPRVVATYKAIRTEVVPDAMTDWAFAQGLVAALPSVIDATTMVFRRYDAGADLVPGGLGTRGPSPGAAVVVPDVIIVPMVAFDRAGIRLGHGAGYYDRCVAALRAAGARPALIGLAFATQEVADIPAQAHDIRMDWIVTETETIDLRRRG